MAETTDHQLLHPAPTLSRADITSITAECSYYTTINHRESHMQCRPHLRQQTDRVIQTKCLLFIMANLTKDMF